MPKAKDTTFVILLCILAGIRIFVFSAAFPFFSNMDEDIHLDMIVKYAAGHAPRGIEQFSAESSNLIAGSGTQEYNTDWYEFAGQDARPFWTYPPAEGAELIREVAAVIHQNINHDSTQSPLYYIVAGSWFRLGKALGLRGGILLYWLRFLNIPIYMLFVWIAHLTARKLYPGDRFLSLGVPAMLTVFPQDVFYALNSDVLLGLLAALSFYLLVTYYLEPRSKVFCVLAGLSVAGAFLTKVTSLPLLVFFGIVFIAKAARSGQKGGVRGSASGLVLMALSAAVPIAAWLLRDKLALGEFSGSHAKMVVLGWTIKPIGELFHHPIFTPSGAVYFWGDLMKTLWRGELIWHRVRIASTVTDGIYVLSSTAFLLAAGVAAWRHKAGRSAGVMSFLMLGLSVGFLIGLSMIYDFHECVYPSRELPFFTSGRLILGALIPFLMLYLVGLGAILDYLKIGRLRWVALGLLMALILGSEVFLTTGVFGSAYNFYHMLRS